MRLWDETIEGYRAEAQAMLDHLPFGDGGNAGEGIDDPVARAEAQRQNMIQFEPEPSAMAVDATIRDRLGTFRCGFLSRKSPRPCSCISTGRLDDGSTSGKRSGQ